MLASLELRDRMQWFMFQLTIRTLNLQSLHRQIRDRLSSDPVCPSI